MTRRLAIAATILATLASIAWVASPQREPAAPVPSPPVPPQTWELEKATEAKIEERWGRLGFAALLPEERDWVLLWWLHVEVDNNSFNQFFGNSTGNEAPEMLDILERVGAVKARAILAEAMAVYNPAGGYTTDRWERRDRAERVQELLGSDDLWGTQDSKFSDCDEPFRAWAISRVLAAYAREGL